MSSLPQTIRQLVKQRSGNRCEYCLSHQDYVMGLLEIDHVFPLAKGGTNTADNLCLACALCNQYKWTKTEGLDPENGVNVALFNPRQQKWSQHFTWSEDGAKIIGWTACGGMEWAYAIRPYRCGCGGKCGGECCLFP